MFQSENASRVVLVDCVSWHLVQYLVIPGTEQALPSLTQQKSFQESSVDFVYSSSLYTVLLCLQFFFVPLVSCLLYIGTLAVWECFARCSHRQCHLIQYLVIPGTEQELPSLTSARPCMAVRSNFSVHFISAFKLPASQSQYSYWDAPLLSGALELWVCGLARSVMYDSGWLCCHLVNWRTIWMWWIINKAFGYKSSPQQLLVPH